jgi:NADPH2:quinone reductase
LGILRGYARVSTEEQATDAVFSAVTAGVIKPATWNVFPLSDAAAAHAALEGGQSAGAILLKP